MNILKGLVLWLVFIFIFTSCSTNIFDPFSRDGSPVPFISTAESLTEEGDAHFANGDLDAALKSYDEALKKDAYYQPAIIGRISVKLQQMVIEEFPGKQTFTAAVLPLIYESLESLGEVGSGELTYSRISVISDIAVIQQKTKVFQEVDWAYRELANRIAIPSTSVLVNMTVLLSYDALYRLIFLLETVENLQTLANQFQSQSDGNTQFQTDVTSLVSVNITGIDASGVQNQIPIWRDTYQRLYYVYYFFQNVYINVETQIRELDSLLTTFVARVSTSNNKIIKDLVPQIQNIQKEISDITAQFDQASALKADFENQVVPRVRDLENELNGLDAAVKDASGYTNFDLSLCGLSFQSGNSTFTGITGATQLDTSSEYNSPPVISDSPDNPCTGNNVRLSTGQ